jgi:hypothetical protein
MNRLHSEIQRLYGPAAPHTAELRALVLELARPADWEALSKVWRGVQADLRLPAPAIAVSGTDGLQLWFSLQQPIPAAVAATFLQRLHQRYLTGVAASRVRHTGPSWQARPVPAQQAGTENWSAFVAPDLAPVFSDTPWLDIEPGADGQAELLAKHESIKPEAFDAAMQVLEPAQAPDASPADEARDIDPTRFLQRVLNDESAAISLRIEAAKALLQFAPAPARHG